MFQLQLAIANLRDRKYRQNPAYADLPPARLRHRVHGSLDMESYVQTGKILAQNIRDLCAMADRDIYSFDNVLDFGSGSGRVLSNFPDAPGSCRLHGTDIDAEMVNWCQSNLPGICWSVNGYLPPLTAKDETFDLIYAISVFTHLDEEFQHAWLRELHRIARPKAIIILTVHGEHCIKELPPSLQKKISLEGFLFIKAATGLLKVDKLPDFYQSAFHTKEYIYQQWPAYFDVLHYVDRAINNHQDAVILQKR